MQEEQIIGLEHATSYEAESSIMTVNSCLVTSMGEDTLCQLGRKTEGREDVI
jgi:hypothetical protein